MISSSRSLSLAALLALCGAVAAEPARDRFGDPLPEGAIARLGSLGLRHNSSVSVVGFSPDGRILAAYDGGSHLVYWDTTRGREVRRVPVNLHGLLKYVRFSPDGKSLILFDDSSNFRVIDALTGAERRKVELSKQGYPYMDLRAVAVSRDGNAAVTLYAEGAMIVWDLAKGKRLGEYKTQTEIERFSSHPIALTPDGKQLVLPHKDGSLHLLDAASGKEVLAFEMPSHRPEKPQKGYPIVTVSPNGRYLAYGGSSNRAGSDPSHFVTLCDLKTGKRLRELSSKENIHQWVFTPDNRSLAVSDAETIRFFDVSSGKETKTLRKPRGGGLVFSLDGRKMATAWGTCIHLWDAEAGRPLHSLIGHDWFIRTIHFFPDGKRLVSNTSAEMIVWDVAGSRPLAIHRTGQLQQWISVPAEGDTVRFLDWKPRPSPRRRKERRLNEKGLEEGEEPRPSGMEIQQIYRWDLATDRKEQQTVFSTPAACDWFALSPDGQRMATVTLRAEPKVSLGDVKGGKPAVSAALPDSSRVIEVVFAPAGRRLFVRSWYGAVRVLDGATGQRVRDLKPDTSGRRIASTPAFAPDGRSVVLNDGRLCIREIASGKDRLQISPSSQTDDLTFSPNGRYLAWNSHNGNDGSTRVLSTATGKLLARWKGNQGTATALAFSPDSRLLATGGYNGTILLWKITEDDGLSATLTKEEAVALWQGLADDDAARAHRALAGLAAAPEQAVPLIKERFPTAWKKPDAKQLMRWIAELDDDSFKVREQATRELLAAGTDAADALRKALAHNPSTEERRRMEVLLHRLDQGGGPEHLRALRAIEVLERIGTPPAKDVLRQLSRKPLPTDLDDEIHASLRRLDEGR